MRDYRDAKTMARSLRSALSQKNISIKQSDSLEIIARTLGAKDWNTLSAAIRSGEQVTRTQVRNASAGHSAAMQVIPVLPLRDLVVLPKSVSALYVGRERSLRAAEHAMAHDGRILLVTQKLPDDDEPSFDNLYRTGVISRILQCLDNTRDGWLLLSIQGDYRASVEEFSGSREYYQAKVAPLNEQVANKAQIAALSQRVFKQFQSYANARGTKVSRLPSACERDPVYLADAIASRLQLSISEKQGVLDNADIGARLANVSDLMIRSAESK
jgi:uncharacterized protein